MTFQLLAIVTATAGLGMLALTHGASAEYFMFSTLIALLIVSYVSSRLSVSSLVIQRRVSDRVYENDDLKIQLEVSNRGRLPRFLLDLTDRSPPLMESTDQQNFTIPTIWPGETVTLQYTVRPLKRGVYTWKSSLLSASDPFGIFQRYVSVAAPGEAIVYPKPLEIDGRLALAGFAAGGMSTGEHSRGSESGLDFYGIRDYQAGDELRRIHWPATAHHNRLTVIEFDRGASDNVTVILDTKAGSEFGTGMDTTLEVGVRAAATLIHWALQSEGIAALAFADSERPRWLSVEKVHEEHQALEALARVQAESTLPISDLLSHASQRLGFDSDVVVITAAPDDVLPSVTSSLRSRNIRVTVLLLEAPTFDERARYPSTTANQLRASGASVVELPRGRALREALRSVIADH